MTDTSGTFAAEKQAVEQLRGARERILKELSKIVVGQNDVVAVRDVGFCQIFPQVTIDSRRKLPKVPASRCCRAWAMRLR